MNDVIKYIENAGRIKLENRKFALNLCNNHFLNDAIAILDLKKVFYNTMLIDGYGYQTNLFDFPKHWINTSNQNRNIYELNDIVLYDDVPNLKIEHQFMQNCANLNINQQIIKIHHHVNFAPLVKGVNIFNSEEARSKLKNHNSEVIIPYINEKTFFNKKEARVKNCYSIFSAACFGQESWNAIHSHQNEMIDKINAGHYNGSKNINDLLNDYKITVSYRTDPCSYENFAAMICGCVPVLVNPITPYNESIFRNGDTCFVANSTEEADDIIETLINNKSLLNTISENIQEIMKLVNIKEKFVDKWNTVIN